MSTPLTVLNNGIISLCNGIPPKYCNHQVISYKTPIHISDEHRRLLMNSKAYIGIFSGSTAVEFRRLYFHLKTYQFVLWEKVRVNPNNLKKYLILKVTFKRPYVSSLVDTFSIGISSKGLFFLLHKEKLPGDRGYWYYPLMHYPRFQRVPDLLRYLAYIHNYSAYTLASLDEIAHTAGRYQPFNKYHMLNYYTEDGEFSDNGVKCKFCDTRNSSQIALPGNVRSLQNLAACVVQTYCSKIAFTPVLIHKLKCYIPPPIFNYVSCCTNYIQDDILLNCSCFTKKY
jgi:hypothetical protein